MQSETKILLGRVTIGVLAFLIAGVLAAWYAGGELIAPARHSIGRPPPTFNVANATFVSGSGSLIQGWLANGTAGQGVVMLLHGVRGDRRDMLSRAEFLNRLGYAVLLFDFQAHGESRGESITFGDRESRDVVAAIQYLRHKFPRERIGVVGVSLGAAAFVLADGRGPVNAVVLESMYPTLERAVAARLRLHLGPVAPLFAPLLTVQLHSRLGLDTDRLRPIDRMARIGAPVFILNGTLDKQTPIQDAQALFAAASAPKQLWAVEGAAHVDLHASAKADYERRVAQFLGKYLRQTAMPASPADMTEQRQSAW